MKKIVPILMLASITSLFAMPSTPPMPPSFGMKSDKPYPKSCKALPKMIVFLPPPMESDFIQCKNDLNMPLISEATKSIITQFGKGISSVKVSLAKGFHQLYRVDFTQDKKSRTVFVNGSLTKFIDSSVMNFTKGEKK